MKEKSVHQVDTTMTLFMAFLHPVRNNKTKTI